MQTKTLTFQRGVFWLFAGWQLYKRNPPLLISLAMAYLIVVIGLSLVPVVGMLLLAVALPFLTLAIANGCAAIAAGNSRPLPQGALWRGMRENVNPLRRLGVLNLCGVLVMAVLAMLLGIGGDIESVENINRDALLKMMLQMFLLSLPWLVAFWFAPLLSGWDGLPAVKSVFFSWVAAIRNWRALLGYALAITLVAVVLPSALLMLAYLIAPVVGQVVATVVQLLATLVLMPVLMAGVYLSYQDVFVHE